MEPVNNSPIVGRVCKHVHQSFSRYNKFDDLVALKITNVHEDGTRSTTFQQIKNYQQPFWIVRPEHRKFKQHKDYIEAKKCTQYKANAAKMAYMVSKILEGRPNEKADLKQLKNNPYLFGLDQTTPVYLKQKFFDLYPQYQTVERYNMAAYDVETDMFKDTEPVMMASVTYGPLAFHASVRSWWDGKTDEEIFKEIKEAEEEPEFKARKEARGCKSIEWALYDTHGDAVNACIQKMHEWGPDYVASHNAIYDMEKNEEALKDCNYDLARTYSDPSIPKEFAKYEFNRGREFKIKENGDQSALEPQEKFPTIRSMAKWEWVDHMSFYAIKRAPAGKLDGYGLNDCAAREGVKKKYYTKIGSHLIEGKAEWHRFMQKYHKAIYCLYNVDDNWRIEDINAKTLDLSMSFPLFINSSEYHSYPSQPRIISDALSFVARDLGYIWGCVGTTRKDEFTNMLPTLGQWIALLETEKNAPIGYSVFDGLVDVISNGRYSVSDVDVSAAYPEGIRTANVSNFTTQIEVCGIQGKTPLKHREISINYASSPEANAVSLANELFGFPSFDCLIDVFENCLQQGGLDQEFYAMLAAEEPMEEDAIEPEVEETV